MAIRCSGHGRYCIIPPVVLENIARNGSREQRERALETLAVDMSLRTARLQVAGRLGRQPGGQPGLPLLAETAQVRPQRFIYDAKNTETLPGALVRGEGDGPTGDAAVAEAYDGLGATFDLYQDEYGRVSIDDEGMPLIATVHYGRDYNNAFWDGTQMVFGDGDGELFNRFTISLDVIGHELTHGVVEDEAGLVYLNQPGALNESVSDIFGSLVKQYQLDQTADEADWLIEAGLFTDEVQGVALRSMKAPGTAYDDPVIGKDPQPAHMRDFVNTTRDNGGVHINSGIPNHAFYLAATNIGGKAWEKAGQIWYDALRDSRIRPTARFRTFARATVRVAHQGFGKDEAEAVEDAWRTVGVRL
jgi:Zn-dependent metalloprotease